MPILSGTRTRNLLATAILLAVPNAAMATPTEPGVSRDLAAARAARLSNIRYRLSFTLKEHESAVAGTETLTFESRTAGDLSIDYRDGVLQSATLNGHPIPKELENGHLNLPAIVGQNTLTLAFISNAAPSGKAITRYEDKDDGNEYFYTLFVPTRKRQKTLEPLDLGVAVVFDLVPSVGTAQNRRDADQKYLFQKMFPRPLNPRITQLSKVFQGTVHLPISARQNR